MNALEVLNYAELMKKKMIDDSCGSVDISKYKFFLSPEIYKKISKDLEDKTNPTLLGIPVKAMDMPLDWEIVLMRENDDN